jgi:outer membrane protein
LIIPLYTGGAVSSRSREAAYNYEASRQSLENLQRDIIRTVRNAYRGQETAISQIKALDQTRVSTRSALEANQAGYEVGTRTIVDVLDAERAVYLAEANYAQARYSYIANYLVLRQAAGQLSDADVAEINGWLGGPRPTSGEPVAPPAKEPFKSGASKNGGKNGKNAAAKSASKEPVVSEKSPRKATSSAPAPEGKPPSTAK